MFAYFTLVAYLVVGTVAVRFMTSESQEFSVSVNYLKVFEETNLPKAELAHLKAPEQTFRSIVIPSQVPLKRVVKAKLQRSPAIEKSTPEIKFVVAKHELPFHEPVSLEKVVVETDLEVNLVALFVPAPQDLLEMVAEKKVEDEVSTTLAKNDTLTEVEAEPTFFDYDAEAPQAATPTQSPIIENATAAVENPIVPTVVEKAVDKSEEVAVDDLITFDYSGANQAVATGQVPTVSRVTTQPSLAGSAVSPVPVAVPNSPKGKGKAKGITPERHEYSSNVTIQVTGTDLKKNFPVNNFEVRPQDDLSLTSEDYGSGEVSLTETLAATAMNRSVSILKRGFAPTNAEIILESGASSISLPMIEEEKFNALQAPFEARGPVGAVLVELDDDTEAVQIDVPVGKVINLDGNLKKTVGNDYRYQLFVGVKAGNALLSFKDTKGEINSKIIHVHEHELTYDTNFFEEAKFRSVALYEEDLLGKEKSPLIVGASFVKLFATDKEATKVNDHTYKIAMDKWLLGGRQYLELNHQDEPVFVGLRDKNKIDVPSEAFMRHILSRFEGSSLGNRCLVQVNLSKKIERVDVGSESVADSLMTYVQYLDRDGKFYDSAGGKTRKVIIVGENQGSDETALDSKINLKVTYRDGSVQYLGTYCSPNTYLVEQL